MKRRASCLRQLTGVLRLAGNPQTDGCSHSGEIAAERLVEVGGGGAGRRDLQVVCVRSRAVRSERVSIGHRVRLAVRGMGNQAQSLNPSVRVASGVGHARGSKGVSRLVHAITW